MITLENFRSLTIDQWIQEEIDPDSIVSTPFGNSNIADMSEQLHIAEVEYKYALAISDYWQTQERFVDSEVVKVPKDETMKRLVDHIFQVSQNRIDNVSASLTNLVGDSFLVHWFIYLSSISSASDVDVFKMINLGLFGSSPIVALEGLYREAAVMRVKNNSALINSFRLSVFDYALMLRLKLRAVLSMAYFEKFQEMRISE